MKKHLDTIGRQLRFALPVVTVCLAGCDQHQKLIQTNWHNEYATRIERICALGRRVSSPEEIKELGAIACAIRDEMEKLRNKCTADSWQIGLQAEKFHIEHNGNALRDQVSKLPSDLHPYLNAAGINLQIPARQLLFTVECVDTGAYFVPVLDAVTPAGNGHYDPM